MKCGSGTYVRSLGRDLAAALGSGAVMTALERTAIGPFRSADAIHAEQLASEQWETVRQPVQRALIGWSKTVVSEEQIVRLRDGVFIEGAEAAELLSNMTNSRNWSEEEILFAKIQMGLLDSRRLDVTQIQAELAAHTWKEYLLAENSRGELAAIVEHEPSGRVKPRLVLQQRKIDEPR